MKKLIFLLFIFHIASCKKDDSRSYPIVYNFDHVDHSEQGLYIVETPNTVSPLPLTSGTFGIYKENILTQIEEFRATSFGIKEVVLLDEQRVHLHLIIDELAWDTIVYYTRNGDDIMIDDFASSGLLYFNHQEDQFESCMKTSFAIPGPETINPGPNYNQFYIDPCLQESTVEEYIQLMLFSTPYNPQDTLGVIISRFIYK